MEGLMDEIVRFTHYDLATKDGIITKINYTSETTATADLLIQNISSQFVGFAIEPALIQFNIKSTLAQLGLNGYYSKLELDKKNLCAEVTVELKAIGPIATALLKLLEVGAFIGKLFAADDRRKVRDPDYISRMFGRSDLW